MSSEIAISARGLSKCYPIFDQPKDRLKQMLSLGRRKYYREFWAIKDVDLEVCRGETVGVIGRNGSGKSTLLQLVCGTLAPTHGELIVNGRVAALLELGAGFNPEFTGRENVVMNASILGLARAEIEKRLDSIIAFADVGQFIDQQVKTYSSGMYVRLAFSVAAHVDADVLIIDEALAVGDAFFVQKCMRFLRTFRERGGTLLFVSHDLSSIVNLCHRALLLENGSVFTAGDPEDVCARYLEKMYEERSATFNGSSLPNHSEQDSIVRPRRYAFRRRELVGHEQPDNPIEVSDFNRLAPSFGLGGAEITDAGFFDEDGNRRLSIKGGEDVCFSIFCTSKRGIVSPALGMMIKDRLGQLLFTEGTDVPFRNYNLQFLSGQKVRADFLFPMPTLAQGAYTISVAVAEGPGHDHVQHHWIHDAIVLTVSGSRLAHGLAGFSTVKTRMTFLNNGSVVEEEVDTHACDRDAPVDRRGVN